MSEPTIEPTRRAEPGRGTDAIRLLGMWALVGLLAACAASPAASPVSNVDPTTSASSGVASAAIGSLFGGTYEQLPADFREGIEVRVEAIVPSNFHELTALERRSWLAEKFMRGLVRLDDATLTQQFRLRSDAVGQLPVADCAAFARQGASGALPPGTGTLGPMDPFMNALPADKQADWVDITVSAMEAQMHGTAVPRTVTKDEVDKIYPELERLATPEELDALRVPPEGTTLSDAALCEGLRAAFAVETRLPDADLAVFARHQLQP